MRNTEKKYYKAYARKGLFKIVHGAEFTALKNQNHKIISKSFILLYNFPSGVHDNNLFMFGVIASKKIGNAVSRNKAKRIIKALIVKIFEHFDFASINPKILFIARPALLQRDFIVIEREMKYCIHKMFEEYKNQKCKKN